MPDTTIAVVTALSPSPTTLAEYGLHLLTALGRKRGVRVVALVEDLPLAYPDIPGVEVRRSWRFGSAANPWRIARAARAAGADAVILNAHFTSFGSSKVSAALGLMTPVVLRMSALPVITLMHNIVETVDLGSAGFRTGPVLERILRSIGTILTWVVLRSNLVTTTMPRYVEILRTKYRATNVALTPHGSFGAPPPPPEAPSTSATVMTFGKFGTYKKVETLIDAVRSLGRPDVRLVIAGADSPNTPGYLAGVEAAYAGPDVLFRGYVAEEDVEGLFRSASVTVFPYTATRAARGYCTRRARSAVLPSSRASVTSRTSCRGRASRDPSSSRTTSIAWRGPSAVFWMTRRSALGSRGRTTPPPSGCHSTRLRTGTSSTWGRSCTATRCRCSDSRECENFMKFCRVYA